MSGQRLGDKCETAYLMGRGRVGESRWHVFVISLRSKKVRWVRKVVQLPLLGTIEPYNTLASGNKPRIRDGEVKAERSRKLSAA